MDKKQDDRRRNNNISEDKFNYYVDERKQQNNKYIPKAKKQRTQNEAVTKEPMTRETRKVVNRVVCLSIVGIAIIIGVILSLTVLFGTEIIQATQTSHYTQEEIIKASNLRYGDNIFTCDKKTAEENIEKQLPYIQDAKIEIKIPNTLVINVVEAEPAFAIKEDNEYTIINEFGKVLEFSYENEYEAQLVVTPEITKKILGEEIEFEENYVIDMIREIKGSADAYKLMEIIEINVSDVKNIYVNYQNRIKIDLGDQLDLDYKMLTAHEIIEQKLSANDKGRLDVSTCNVGIKASYFKDDDNIFEITSNTQEETQPVTENDTQTVTDEDTQ